MVTVAQKFKFYLCKIQNDKSCQCLNAANSPAAMMWGSDKNYSARHFLTELIIARAHYCAF